jgi:HYR domain
MSFALLRRSLVAAATISMLTIPHAFAENVDADRDLLTALPQSSIDFGTVEAGGSRAVDVYFVLTCSGTNHVNSDQFVKLTVATKTVPSGGFATVPGLTFGLGGAWPADGEPCPTDLAPTIGGPVHITVMAPTTPGSYRYFFAWSMSVTPASADDNGVFGTTRPSFTVLLTVPGGTTNTPPTLNVPADSTVEGNVTGGANVTYTVTASDAEDATAPVPSCSPASGLFVPLGSNTINCTVTDGGGLTTTGSFLIRVVDTTAPVLASIADIDVTTSDPSGAVVDFGSPTLVEAVDPAPTASCTPAAGTKFPVGTTVVTCTARDASGNTSTTNFSVRVHLVQTLQALWEDPVGASAGIAVNGARTVPVKVQLLVGGQPVVSGTGRLDVVACGGGPAVMTDDLAIQSNGRWMGHLDTGGLTPGCYQVVASVDGQAIGSFRMDVRGDATGASKPAAKPVTGKPTKP